MGRYNWTAKRRAALECLVRSMGNVRIAAELSDGCVSESYINELKYEDKHAAFRIKFHELTEKLLNSMEVDAEFVISRLVKIADSFPPPQKVQALKLLGDYLGIWAPEKREISINIMQQMEELELDAKEVVAEAERILQDAGRRGVTAPGD